MSDMIHAVREAVGDEVDIGCEIHRSLQPHESVRLMQLVEDVNLLFFEDPINYENYQTIQSVARRAMAPIGVGERSFCIQDVDMLLREDNISFLRPDVAIMGGITGCKKAAAIAESHNVNVIPHIATGSICYAASLHLAAAIPNFEVMEMCPAPGEWPKIQQEIKTPFVIENGYMLMPEGPGLGVELGFVLQRIQVIHDVPLGLRSGAGRGEESDQGGAEALYLPADADQIHHAAGAGSGRAAL